MKKDYAQYLLEKTREDYILIAKDFSRTRKFPWSEMRFLFDDYLIPNDKVLDLGCGNGRYFPFFNERKIDYYGVDNCAELIKIAKDKYPQARFQVEEALNLSFPDNSFDKVYGIAVLHQIPVKNFGIQFLKEVKRVLRPRGLIVLTVWKLHRPKDIRLLLKYTFLKIIRRSELDWGDLFIPWGKKTKRYYHYFFKKEIEDLVRKAGLRIIKSGVIKSRKGDRQNIYLVAEKPL